MSKRCLPGEKFVKHCPNSKNIATLVDQLDFTIGSFGSEVRRCSRGMCWRQLKPAGCQTEIDDGRFAGIVYDDVCGLKIAM